MRDEGGVESRSRSTSSSYEYEEEEEEASRASQSSSSTPRKPRRPKLVANRYRLGEKLGSGSYSDVYLAVDKISGDSVAVKLEWTRAEKTDKLLGEAKFYESLQRDIGIPKVRWLGEKGEFKVLVLDRLGPSLDNLFKKLKVFSLKTVVMLAKQMIDRLEYVHDAGLLYRDMKPHNFLMGLGEKGSKRVYLVDFGLAKRYRDEATGKHCKLHIKKGRGVTGTVRYSSTFCHDGYDASRRDDMVSLGYVLLHFLKGGLPWLGLSAKSKKSKHALIGKRKAQTTDEELCAGFPSEFVRFFSHCRALDFYERPDYLKLQSLLDSIMVREGFANDGVYDWMPTEQRDCREGSTSAGSKEEKETAAETAEAGADSGKKRKHGR